LQNKKLVVYDAGASASEAMTVGRTTFWLRLHANPSLRGLPAGDAKTGRKTHIEAIGQDLVRLVNK